MYTPHQIDYDYAAALIHRDRGKRVMHQNNKPLQHKRSEYCFIVWLHEKQKDIKHNTNKN
jgi:hypothetical protein